MTPLLAALGAAALVGTGALGVRLITSTGLEQVEAQYRTAQKELRTGGLAGLLDVLGRAFLRPMVRLYGSARLRKLDVAIRRAGRPDGVTVTVYVQRQAGAIVLGFLLLLVFGMVGQWIFGVFLVVILSVWMRVWLLGATQSRQKQLDRELPDFLDVLGVTVLAGLGFRQAVERVCDFHDGALAEEMRRTLREMDVGVSRRHAFVGLRERTSSEAVGAFVTALLQAEELGVPLSDALEQIGRDSRREHAQRVRQKAAQAGPKVSLVVTLTIMPGAMLLIMSAIVFANLDVVNEFIGS